MDSGKRLSLREQRILAEIEAELRQDRRLDDRLRTLRPPARVELMSVQRRMRGIELGLLIPITIMLSLAAARSAKLGIIIACCCVGLVTVLLLASVVRSRIAQRRVERVTESGESGTWRQTSP